MDTGRSDEPAVALTPWEDPSYKLVYQSGHTDTWCNGEKHVHSMGGKAGWKKSPLNRPAIKCDCEVWRKAKETGEFPYKGRVIVKCQQVGDSVEDLAKLLRSYLNDC